MGRSKTHLPSCARFVLPSVIFLFFKPSPPHILCWTRSLTYWVSGCLSALTEKCTHDALGSPQLFTLPERFFRALR